ncbi:hypothetical protein Fmac_013525 [Flemingia macrophylla]|uniref:Uncharacterized protein n=1 Tax=Flemingia macrophylla TaxID=520843 RepID=A0ABD1MTD3_9FABA
MSQSCDQATVKTFMDVSDTHSQVSKAASIMELSSPFLLDSITFLGFLVVRYFSFHISDSVTIFVVLICSSRCTCNTFIEDISFCSMLILHASVELQYVGNFLCFSNGFFFLFYKNSK